MKIIELKDKKLKIDINWDSCETCKISNLKKEKDKSLLRNEYGKEIKVINTTKANNPVHPLYQSNNSILIDYIL